LVQDRQIVDAIYVVLVSSGSGNLRDGVNSESKATGIKGTRTARVYFGLGASYDLATIPIKFQGYNDEMCPGFARTGFYSGTLVEYMIIVLRSVGGGMCIANWA